MTAPPLPVTIISGYLGAGKTTLVNHLLRHNGGRRIAVAVNEFGALPIDSDLIEGADGNVLTLAGGCICCTFGSDLVAGLMDLAQRAGSIDHILIEASGVALPGAIAQSLSLVAGLTLDAIVVVADAETVRARAADIYMGDTITRQLADAELVIVNKTDLIGTFDLDALLAWLPSQAPGGRFVQAQQAAVAADIVLGIDTPSRFQLRPSNPPHMMAAYASETFEFDHPVNARRLAESLANVETGLVRAKGFVEDATAGWLTLQVVGRRSSLSPMPPKAKPHGVLVCISHGRRLDRAPLAAILAEAAMPHADAHARPAQSLAEPPPTSAPGAG